MIDGEFIINPTLAQKAVSDLQLTVASTREKVIMIEAGAFLIPEDKMIEAIYKAHEVNQEIIKFIDQIVAECGKEKHSYESCAVPQELFDEIKKIVPPEEGSDLCHRFVMHGRAACNARKPECEKCCLKDICRTAREAAGQQAEP